MNSPADYYGFFDASPEAEDAEIRSSYRAAFIGAVILLVLVPLAAAVVTKTKIDFTPTLVAPEGTLMSWVAHNESDRKTFLIGDYALTLSSREKQSGERVAVLNVKASNGEEITVHGQLGYPIPSADFGVGRFDPHNPTSQVIFTTYSGGTHCCTKITVLELAHDRWHKIDLGTWDGDPLAEFPEDVDGDGVSEIVLKDDRFDYAFAPYSETYKPPRIVAIRKGRAVDVSHSARYDKLYEADMNTAYAGCMEHKNAACAAFVADASRLGRWSWAWNIMKANYHRSKDWDFPTKCTVPLVKDACPPGRSEQFREFPDALEWFLTDKGYVNRRSPGEATRR